MFPNHRHWTYKCKNEWVDMSQPSRTQQLKNRKLKMKLSISSDWDIPDIRDETAGKTSKKSKRKHRSNSDSCSDGEASVFETDSGLSSVTGSDYSSPESSSGYSSSYDSEEERRRRREKKKQRKGRRRRDSSSFESSDSDSESESDFDDRGSRKKSRRHNGSR